jgi:hypothetical protein
MTPDIHTLTGAYAIDALDALELGTQAIRASPRRMP